MNGRFCCFPAGKILIVMVHLALKAFRPARLPFPVMHVDTGHNFPELIEYRDNLVRDMNLRLVVASVEDAINTGIADQPPGEISRNQAQAPTLVHAIDEHRFQAAFGGGRRDEEKARAKERVFSFRDAFGGWEPRSQRPELWNLYNGGIHEGENIRAFPISNWTELDVWQYLDREKVPLPSLYFSHQREVFMRDGQWLATCEYLQPRDGEGSSHDAGALPYDWRHGLHGAWWNPTRRTVADIIDEVAATRVSERGGRADDKFAEDSMQKRKEKGYF